ncbi:MAG: MarR family winged helix-turn-helix transcriptional regulator [Dehalococcoidia bacterium]
MSESSQANHYSEDRHYLTDSGDDEVKDLTGKTPLGLLLSLILSCRSLERYLEVELSSHDVTPNMVLIMAALIRSGGRMTPTQIARIACRRKNTITSTINTLVNAGEVRIENSEHDGRVKFVTPTAQGRETAVWLTPIAQDISRKVLSTLTDEEIDVLVRSMRKIRDNLMDTIL